MPDDDGPSLAADGSLTTYCYAHVRADFNYTFLTQKERDIETNLDYFLARYYSSTQGRFTYQSLCDDTNRHEKEDLGLE